MSIYFNSRDVAKASVILMQYAVINSSGASGNLTVC